MYLQHFGLKHDPLGKNIRELASNHRKRLSNYMLAIKRWIC